jgi:HSP20 family molecular chaperone IbpA
MSPKKTKQVEVNNEVEKIEEKPADATPAQLTAEMFEQAGELVVDVFETDDSFVVLAAIAGIQIKDLDISLEKDMMVIKGNRCDPHTSADKKYFYQECYWGPF